jgi:Zn-dependent protease with chaperone function
MPVAARDFIHPEDKAAQEQLKAIPLFDQFVKMFLKIGIEQFVHNLNMAEKIRLGPDQLPHLYDPIPPICETLGIEVPEVYLEMNPVPNAYALGDSRPSVVLTSGLVEAMDEDELQAVLAHECGHIVCRHTLYRTMTLLLIRVGPQIFGPLAALSMPIQLALLYWSRRGELSADRAAAVVLGDPKPIVETMIRLAGGPKSVTGKVNLEAYLKQAEAFDKMQESTWDKVLQTVATMQQTHPFQSVRCREILRWCETDQYRRIVAGLADEAAAVKCTGCAKPVAGDWKFCKHCGQKLEHAA